MSTQPAQYAVMGNPIGHSKSPLIHSLFAKQTGQTITYRTILAATDQFKHAVDAFRSEGGKGLNITIPFKPEAVGYADKLSARASRAQAVNTLRFDEDGVYGDNTDGPGLVRDLTHNHGVALQNKHILLLGAGGAARGVLQPLLAAQPAQLTIANRTASKALALARLFSDVGIIRGCSLEELTGSRFSLIINATAVGLQNKVPPLPDDILQPGGCCYDMVYADEPTAFVRWGQGRGAKLTLDGLGMLVEQAAESFQLWRGIRPMTAAVIKQLRPSR